MNDFERIEMVLDWAEDHPDFDTTFVENLKVWLSTRDRLTDGQSAALDRIIEGYRIG